MSLCKSPTSAPAGALSLSLEQIFSDFDDELRPYYLQLVNADAKEAAKRAVKESVKAAAEAKRLAYALEMEEAKTLIAHNKELDKVAIPLSKHLAPALDCPIELIESQWEGAWSVYEGVRFIDEFLTRLQNSEHDMSDLKQRCAKTLQKIIAEKAEYKVIDDANFFELESRIVQEFPRRKEILIEILMHSRNAPALCKTGAYALSAGLHFFGLTLGWNNLHCTTSLGRRFIYTGPLLGGGYIYGAAIGRFAVNKESHGFSRAIEFPQVKLKKFLNNHLDLVGGVIVLPVCQSSRSLEGHSSRNAASGPQSLYKARSLQIGLLGQYSFANGLLGRLKRPSKFRYLVEQLKLENYQWADVHF